MLSFKSANFLSLFIETLLYLVSFRFSQCRIQGFLVFWCVRLFSWLSGSLRLDGTYRIRLKEYLTFH